MYTKIGYRKRRQQKCILLALLDSCVCKFNSFIASGVLITFANSLDPDQDRENVGLDLDPNCLTLV